MVPLIAGIILILLGSLGLDLTRRRRFNRRSTAKGGEPGAQTAVLQPRFTDVLIIIVSLLSIAAGLATAFV